MSQISLFNNLCSVGVLYDEKGRPLEPSFPADRSDWDKEVVVYKGVWPRILRYTDSGVLWQTAALMLLWTWVQTSTAGINILFCNHRSSRASLCRWGQKSAGSQSKCAVVCSVDWSPAAPRFFLGDGHFQRQELMLNIPLSGWQAY